MEPGHEDREYHRVVSGVHDTAVSQWSPVMKTGNTDREFRRVGFHRRVSMEPGHEDREYARALILVKLLGGPGNTCQPTA